MLSILTRRPYIIAMLSQLLLVGSVDNSSRCCSLPNHLSDRQVMKWSVLLLLGLESDNLVSSVEFGLQSPYLFHMCLWPKVEMIFISPQCFSVLLHGVHGVVLKHLWPLHLSILQHISTVTFSQHIYLIHYNRAHSKVYCYNLFLRLKVILSLQFNIHRSTKHIGCEKENLM